MVALPHSLLWGLHSDRSVRRCRPRRKWLPLALFTASRQLYGGYKVDLPRGVSKHGVRGQPGTVGNPPLAIVQRPWVQYNRSRASHTHTHTLTVWNRTPVCLHAGVSFGNPSQTWHSCKVAKLHSINCDCCWTALQQHSRGIHVPSDRRSTSCQPIITKRIFFLGLWLFPSSMFSPSCRLNHLVLIYTNSAGLHCWRIIIKNIQAWAKTRPHAVRDVEGGNLSS